MIYAFVELTVTEPQTFAAYAEKAGAALAKYGAKPEAMSTEPTLLEGDGDAPGRTVLLSFPDKEAAMGWINDPDLIETHKLRKTSGQSRITLIG